MVALVTSTARDLMKDSAESVDAEAGLLGVVDRFLTGVSRQAIVSDGGGCRLGVIGTRRVAQALREATSAARLIAADLVTVGAEAGVARAVDLMQRHAVTYLPVVDECNVVVGIVSRSDLLRVFLRDDAEIREDVIRDVLIEGLDADRDAIEVDVSAGIVTLWRRGPRLHGRLRRPADPCGARSARSRPRAVVGDRRLIAAARARRPDPLVRPTACCEVTSGSGRAGNHVIGTTATGVAEWESRPCTT
jgi:CBS domain-containing protein